FSRDWSSDVCSSDLATPFDESGHGREDGPLRTMVLEDGHGDRRDRRDRLDFWLHGSIRRRGGEPKDRSFAPLRSFAEPNRCASVGGFEGAAEGLEVREPGVERDIDDLR